MFREAAEQGFARAQYNLGRLHADGRGVAQDFAEAAKWYRTAAGQGNAYAMNNLGVMYENGQGVAQGSRGGGEVFSRGSRAGQRGCAVEPRAHVRHRTRVPQDFAEALKWYRQAADQGDARAQFNVGRFHSQGHGVPVDHAEAIKWFRHGRRPE